MSEKALTERVVRRLGSLGAWTLKTHGSGWQRAGVPDVLFCLRGRFGAVECKAPKGRLTRLQQVQLERLRRAGALALVARSVTDVDDALIEAKLLLPRNWTGP